MSVTLNIEHIELKNFLSYGNYVTKLDISSLDPILILGDVDGSDVSNGAGKSSLLSAFIWCLFGRTITNRAPGDKVINWFSGKDCYVRISISDGWEILRTRKIDGHSELVVFKNGLDLTKSTNTNAQKFLEDTFGLDYDIFTSSVFCGQFGQSFLEMTSTKRKEAIERLLGLDKLNQYADLAKVAYQKADNDQTMARSQIDLLKSDIVKQENRLKNSTMSSVEFENNRTQQVLRISKSVHDTSEQLGLIEAPNIENLERRWDAVWKIEKKIEDYRNKIRYNNTKIESLNIQIKNLDESLNGYSGWPYEIPDIDFDKLKENHRLADEALKASKIVHVELAEWKLELRSLESESDRAKLTIKEWEEKEGKACPTCKQDVVKEHISKAIQPFKDVYSEKQDQIAEISLSLEARTDEYDQLVSVECPKMSIEEAEGIIHLNKKANLEIESIKEVKNRCALEIVSREDVVSSVAGVVERSSKSLTGLMPSMNLVDAQKALSEIEILTQKKNNFLSRIDEIKTSDNPYVAVIEDIEKNLLESENSILEGDSKIEHLNVLFAHYKYIYRSYSDRRKIKKWLLSELIPFLNTRIHHYLNAFDVHIEVSFTATLDTQTNKWGYEFCSGGERKRIDLAIMFGLYDLYTSIYGQQCNIMVLDEVDSRLDKRGVESFADIVNSFNSDHKIAIFVISHKDELKDLISSQILIKRRNGFSVIDQT